MRIERPRLAWVWVQVSPDPRPALAVALLQIDVLRIDGYVSDHVDDGTRPGAGEGGRGWHWNQEEMLSFRSAEFLT